MYVPSAAIVWQRQRALPPVSMTSYDSPELPLAHFPLVAMVPVGRSPSVCTDVMNVPVVDIQKGGSLPCTVCHSQQLVDSLKPCHLQLLQRARVIQCFTLLMSLRNPTSTAKSATLFDTCASANSISSPGLVAGRLGLLNRSLLSSK